MNTLGKVLTGVCASFLLALSGFVGGSVVTQKANDAKNALAMRVAAGTPISLLGVVVCNRVLGYIVITGDGVLHGQASDTLEPATPIANMLPASHKALIDANQNCGTETSS